MTNKRLVTVRETLYGGPLTGSSRKEYIVYLDGARIANAPTKLAAEELAMSKLADAYRYATRACTIRVAKDGSVLVFRQLSDDSAMYEFCREDGDGRSTCMGRMANGLETFRTLTEYADYVVGRYDEG